MARTPCKLVRRTMTKTTPTHHAFSPPIKMEVVKANFNDDDYDVHFVEIKGFTVHIKEITADMVIENLGKSFQWQNDIDFSSYVVEDFYKQFAEAVAAGAKVSDDKKTEPDAGKEANPDNGNTTEASADDAGSAAKDNAEEEPAPGPAADGGAAADGATGDNDDKGGSVDTQVAEQEDGNKTEVADVTEIEYGVVFDMAFVERPHKTLLVNNF